MKKPTHGGARKGAGAPKKGKVKLTCHILPATRKALGSKPGQAIDAAFLKRPGIAHKVT